MLKFKLAKKSDLKNLEIIREEDINSIHLERINKQEQGKAEYLIAFDGKKPVGHLFIDYKSKSTWVKSPILVDLYVKQSERKKGLGLKIINYSLEKVKAKGYKKVGLDVETHEHWIRKFYEKLGFKKISGPHKSTYTIKEENNKVYTEITYFLEKEL